VPRPWRRPDPRYLGLLRVDLTALHRGRISGDELCEIAGVGPVPVSVARELLGDAVLKLVITRGVDVLNVTHLGRGPTAAQRVALAWTSPQCSALGCPRTRIEIDHRIDWAHTRHTRLDELDPLCAYHHDLKTRHGWALVPGTGRRDFVPTTDPRHPRLHDDSPQAGRRPRHGRDPDGGAEGGARSRPVNDTDPVARADAPGRMRQPPTPPPRTGAPQQSAPRPARRGSGDLMPTADQTARRSRPPPPHRRRRLTTPPLFEEPGS
jgi:hypothetical protein